MNKFVELKNQNPLNDKVPLNIFQTWHSKKKIPVKMHKAIYNIKLSNPEFRHFLFDDFESREFIKKHFKRDVLNAYDSLIPGAYKADLWRYCILYIFGGVYIDIKYEMVDKKIRFINLIDKEHYVLDQNKIGIYNAFMICKPGNESLFKAINLIVQNVKNNFYGSSYLEPTGPRLLSTIIPVNDALVDMKHIEINGNNNKKVIIFNNTIFLKSYVGHTNDREKFAKTLHYSKLWKQKKIYKKI